MISDSIIFDSELEFRKHLIMNFNNISNIIIFEDNLNKIIYFYSFFSDGLMTATKEFTVKDFSFYSEIYNKLIKELDIDFISESTEEKVLKLKKLSK